jgi:hypothetical protein
MSVPGTVFPIGKETDELYCHGLSRLRLYHFGQIDKIKHGFLG